MRGLVTLFLISIFWSLGHAQNNTAVNMAEILAYNERFNPADNQQQEIIAGLKAEYLTAQLKSDEEKISFWLNIFNANMLQLLRDTLNEGVYRNFYKVRCIVIAGETWSLFDIEHEFLRLGKKSKALGFRKSRLNNESIWKKLRPETYNPQVAFLMYRGLFGYPPYQVIENSNLNEAFLNSRNSLKSLISQYFNKDVIALDWMKNYKVNLEMNPTLKNVMYYKVPFAVSMANFFPRYDAPKFKEEEKNPWLK